MVRSLLCPWVCPWVSLSSVIRFVVMVLVCGRVTASLVLVAFAVALLCFALLEK